MWLVGGDLLKMQSDLRGVNSVRQAGWAPGFWGGHCAYVLTAGGSHPQSWVLTTILQHCLPGAPAWAQWGYRPDLSPMWSEVNSGHSAQSILLSGCHSSCSFPSLRLLAALELEPGPEGTAFPFSIHLICWWIHLQDKLPSDDIPPGAHSVPGTLPTARALVSSACLLLPMPANRGDKY